MKQIQTEEISAAVAKLCIDANCVPDPAIIAALEAASASETSPVGRDILEKLLENAAIAEKERMAICQDTGMAVLFVELGQDVRIVGGSLGEALAEGVRRGYAQGYLRNSVVADPLLRKNTGDNTPPVVHFDIVPGDRLSIDIAPKGFGSENMSALKMLKPSDGVEGVKRFIIDTVAAAGPNACPPMVVGVGLGGTMEKAALLAKKALLRPVGRHSGHEHISRLEEELLEAINALDIGPSGFGGRTTALGINVEIYPTHIAGLPVAVNISCHATRHAHIDL